MNDTDGHEDTKSLAESGGKGDDTDFIKHICPPQDSAEYTAFIDQNNNEDSETAVCHNSSNSNEHEKLVCSNKGDTYGKKVHILVSNAVHILDSETVVPVGQDGKNIANSNDFQCYGGPSGVKSISDIWSNRNRIEIATSNSAIGSNESPSGQGDADSSKELLQRNEHSEGIIEQERAEPKRAAESVVSFDEGETLKSNDARFLCLSNDSKSTSPASVSGTEEITKAIDSSQTNEVEMAPPSSSIFIAESSTDVETEITREPESDSPENGEATCSSCSESEQPSMTPFCSDEAEDAPDVSQTPVSQTSSSTTESVCCDGSPISQPDRSMCSEWCNKESPSEHDNKSFQTSQNTEAADSITSIPCSEPSAASRNDHSGRMYASKSRELVNIQTTCDRQESETTKRNATSQSAGSVDSLKVNLPASTTSIEKTEGAENIDISTSRQDKTSIPMDLRKSSTLDTESLSCDNHSEKSLVGMEPDIKHAVIPVQLHKQSCSVSIDGSAPAQVPSTKQFPTSLLSCRKTLFLQLLVDLCVVIVPASSQDTATNCTLSNVTETLSQPLLMPLNDSKSYDLSSFREYFNAFILVYIAALVFLCLAYFIIYSQSSLSKAYHVFAAVFPRKEIYMYPKTKRSFRWSIGNIKFGHCRSHTSTWLEQSNVKSTSSGKVHQTFRRGRKNTLMHSDGSNTTRGGELILQLESCFLPTSMSAWFPQSKSCWLNAPLLFHVLTCWCAVLPTASHETDANSTLSNVTEILSQQVLMLWNGSESCQLSYAGEPMDTHDTCSDIFVGLLLLCLMSLVFFSALLVAYRVMYGFARKLKVTSKLLVPQIKYEYSRWDTSSESCEGIAASNKSTFTPSILAVGGRKDSGNDTDTSVVVSSDNPIEKHSSPLESTDCPSAYHTPPSQESGYHSRTLDPLSSQTVTSAANDHDKLGVPPEDSIQDCSERSEENIHVPEMPPGISKVNSIADFSRSNDIQETATQDETEVTVAEVCSGPSELVCPVLIMKHVCAHSTRGGVQEVTQPNGRTSELAGVTSPTHERAHRRRRSQHVNSDEPPPRAQGVSSVETIPVQISPESQLLAFNASVSESQHSHTDQNKLLDTPPDYTPITLNSSVQDGSGVLQYNVALLEAEMPMLQLARSCACPITEQGDGSPSAPVYPLLPPFRLPSTNIGQHQPLFPSLPSLPPIDAQVAYVPVT